MSRRSDTNRSVGVGVGVSVGVGVGVGVDGPVHSLGRVVHLHLLDLLQQLIPLVLRHSLRDNGVDSQRRGWWWWRRWRRKVLVMVVLEYNI